MRARGQAVMYEGKGGGGGGGGIRPPYNLIASLVAKRVKVVCASLPQ